MTKTKSVMERLNAEGVKERISKAIGEKFAIEEFMSSISLELARNPSLLACSYESILQCAIDSAAFGLIPNKQLGHVWLIPYKNQCTLQFGYKGYLKKFSEYGGTVEVECVTNQEVNEDRFLETRGTHTTIAHRPIRSGLRKKEDIALAYAILRHNNMPDVIVVMSVEEIIEVAATEIYDKELRKKVRRLKGVWNSAERETDFGEMCKKTLIRRLAKLSSIDVVNHMSSYEGERDGVIIDAKPIIKEINNLKTSIENRDKESQLINEIINQAQEVYENDKNVATS